MTSGIGAAVVGNIVRNLILPGRNYRREIVNMLDAEFLQFALDFFKKVALAKADDETIDIDWYERHFINAELPKKDIALNAGVNVKTISNARGGARKEVVIDEARAHYRALRDLVDSLTGIEGDIDFTLAIRVNKVSVELTINESLIVINGLAVHRAAMRGGLWSSAGKRSEKLLMMTLCKSYSVDEQYWDVRQKSEDGYGDFTREIDFFMVDGNAQRFKCEVKLIGKGNPESADAVIARGSHIFIADTLSQTNKKQMDSLGVHWVALSDDNGYKRFKKILAALNIPHSDFTGDIGQKVDQILASLLR